MKLLGLIGYPLEHSFSKKYFTEKFINQGITGWEYELFPIKDISEIKQLIQNENLAGLNVTIPYKQAIIPYLNSLDESAKAIGAVNTIKVERENGSIRLTGYNTDYIGFKNSLEPLLKKHHKSALVLGTGGSSKAVIYALKALGIKYKTVSSSNNGDFTYQGLTEQLVNETKLIINTTPLGMYPKVDEKPNIPYEALSIDHILYDLVYNPELTAFLREGKENRATIKNGLEMLETQAEQAWKIFTSVK